MGIKSNYDNILIMELFPHCNFNCSFCYQNKDGRPNYFSNNELLYNKSKIYYMNLFLMKYQNYNFGDIDYCDMWGGELFYDDSEEYNNLFLQVLNVINPKKKFGATTNLSHINKALHTLLFEKQPFTIDLGASFDASGRFHTKEMLDNYFRNLEIVKQSPNIDNGCVAIETVLTPEMLDDKYDFKLFDKLYEDPNVGNCLLIDFRGYPDYILNNFGERILRLLKRYPKLDNARNLLAFAGYIKDDEVTPKEDSIDQFCYCNRPTTHYLSYVTKFDITDNCCSSCKRGDYKKVEEAYNCKNCKYNKICSDICSGSLINSGLITLKECPYSYVYDHIDELNQSFINDKTIKLNI